MIIALNALNTRGEFQDFFCQLESLETALDAVSSIAARGNRLLKVVLIEQGSTTLLPLDAFDGQSLSTAIRALEKQWQLALQEGVQLQHRIVVKGQLIELREQRINRHQTTIIQLEQVLTLAQERLQRMQTRRSAQPYYALILTQLEGTLERYQHNLARERASLQRLLNQLQFS